MRWLAKGGWWRLFELFGEATFVHKSIKSWVQKKVRPRELAGSSLSLQGIEKAKTLSLAPTGYWHTGCWAERASSLLNWTLRPTGKFIVRSDRNEKRGTPEEIAVRRLVRFSTKLLQSDRSSFQKHLNLISRHQTLFDCLNLLLKEGYSYSWGFSHMAASAVRETWLRKTRVGWLTLSCSPPRQTAIQQHKENAESL